MSNGLAAVLFDMDGTLVDTEELWGEAMSALAHQPQIGVQDLHRRPHARPDRPLPGRRGQRAAQLVRQGGHGLAPQLLGLHERAVHVEQHRLQRGSAHSSSVR